MREADTGATAKSARATDRPTAVIALFAEYACLIKAFHFSIIVHTPASVLEKATLDRSKDSCFQRYPFLSSQLWRRSFRSQNTGGSGKIKQWCTGKIQGHTLVPGAESFHEESGTAL